MSKSERDKEKNYSFINEQIVSRKRTRRRRCLFAISLTVVCAIIFGIVARFAFAQFGPWVNKVLGIDENKKAVVLTHENEENHQSQEDEKTSYASTTSIIIKDDVTDSITVTPTGSIAPSDTTKVEGAQLTPEVNPTQGEDNENKEINDQQDENKKEDSKEGHAYKSAANIKDFVKINTEIRKKMNESMLAMVNVICIKEETDAFSNPFEKVIEVPGIIIGSDEVHYFILVPYSQVRKADSIKVEYQQMKLDAMVSAWDENSNIAILQVLVSAVPARQRGTIAIATVGESFLLSIGTPVYMLGNVNGCPDSGAIGMITNCNRSMYIPDMKLDLLYTDLYLTRNSTGFVFDLDGKIVGMMMPEIKEEGLEQLYPVVGMSRIKSMLEKMMNGIDQVYLGIVPGELSKEELEELGIQFGVYVSEVKSNSPAYNAGIQNGDIIVSIHGNSVAGINSYMNIINNLTYRSQVGVILIRYQASKHKEMNISVEVGRKKMEADAAE